MKLNVRSLSVRTRKHRVKMELLNHVRPIIGKDLTKLYSTCSQSCIFPNQWKIGKLRLLKKGPDIAAVKSYRPVCLISEVGKVFERIINDRIEYHLHSIESNMPINQFRARRLTEDIIIKAIHPQHSPLS